MLIGGRVGEDGREDRGGRRFGKRMKGDFVKKWKRILYKVMRVSRVGRDENRK